jgi:DNA (cytosine-5)-methyltransferase 1
MLALEKQTAGSENSAGPEASSPVFIDLFAGCGGLSLGLKRAGWRGLFAVEKDDFAFATSDANFNGHPQYDYEWPAEIERRPWDIGELLATKGELLASYAGKIDLVAGGPPCQGFSHAGRRNPDDPRNKLFEDYLKLVDLVKPRIVLVENVRGFDSTFSNDGSPKNFAALLKERLGVDYDCISEIIRASDFGVPQARPRFILVGVRRGEPAARKLASFFVELLRASPGFLKERGLPLRPSARDAISDLEIEHNGRVACLDSKGFEAISYRGPRSEFQKAMRDGAAGPPSDTRLAKHRPDIEARFKEIIRASREEGRLNVTISKEVRARFGLKKMAIRVLDPLGTSPTITSLPDDLLHYSEPRTLTVRENARLQTFPDWFVFKGKYTTGGERRRIEIPRFTQVANAVPPLLAEQIGEVLRDAIS